MTESAYAAIGLITLRMNVDLDPYTPADDAPPWLRGLGQITTNDHGILAVLGPSGLTVRTNTDGRVRVHPDAAALYVAAVGDRIRGTKRRIAIGIPPAARHLPLLLAGSAVLANVIDRQLDPRAPGCGDILVVSPDLDVRSRYGDMFVDKIQLDEAYPGSRMRPNGDRIPLHAERAPLMRSNGVCFFLPGLTLPQHLNYRPALILADLQYARWVKRAPDLATWLASHSDRTGVLALYTIGDDDTRLALMAAGFTDLPLDHAALAACTRLVKEQHPHQSGITVDWVLEDAPDFLARHHVVRPVENADDVNNLFADIGRLLDEQASRESPDLKRARWLLAIMTQLPVPVIWYEQAAQALGRSSLQHLIRRIGTLSRLNTGLGPTLQTLRMMFERLYDCLTISNPRAATLRVLLPALVPSSAADRLLVLVRDRVVERALQDWLALDAFPNTNWFTRIEVRNCALYFPIASEKYKTVLVVGAFPRRYRWIAGAALGDNVDFLAYRHEVKVIERQLQSVYGEQDRADRARQRNAAVAALLGWKEPFAAGPEEGIPDCVLQLPTQQIETSAKRKRAPEIKLNNLAQLADALQASQRAIKEIPPIEANIALWQEDASGDEPSWEDDLESDAREPQLDSVECVPVHVQSRVHGRGTLWLATRRPVEAYRSRAESGMLLVPPTALRSGDILVRLDEAGRTSLFERIVELAEGQPRMEYLGAHRRAWQDAIRQLAGRFRFGNSVDYGTMLHAVQEAGSPIQTELALRYWVDGSVIGPENVKSIVAVGRVVGSLPLIQHAAEFDKAFRQIRGIHQGIGMRLTHLLHRSARGAVQAEKDPSLSILEARLGIAIDELLDTVDLAEVISVGTSTSALPPQRVGRFVGDE